MRQPGGGQIVLAYGAWALAGSAPGKGLPPCIAKGLLKKLNREFLVVAVPEHFTSKKCFKCGGSCGKPGAYPFSPGSPTRAIHRGSITGPWSVLETVGSVGSASRRVSKPALETDAVPALGFQRLVS